MAAYDNNQAVSAIDVRAHVRRLALVFGIGLLACLFGFLTYPVDLPAVFWPANAIILGLFVRRPDCATPAGWAAAAGGFVVAELLAGDGFEPSLWFVLADFAGILVGWLLLRRLHEADRRLARPHSVRYLLGICIVAAASAAMADAGMAPFVYGGALEARPGFRFATELANYVLVLPVLLALPRLDRRTRQQWRDEARMLLREPAQWVPLAVVAASFAATLLIGGPGAVAFLVLALLWAAITYELFWTAVLTMLVCVGQMIVVSAGLVSLPGPDEALDGDLWLPLGVALMGAGALGAAALNAAREAALRRLENAASNDGLTGALTRGAFLGSGADALSRGGVAVLMFDLDNFRRINDRHGRATGDRVLVACAAVVRAGLRSGDLFGRLGGEEFAAVLPGASPDEAVQVAERLRAGIAQLAVVPDEADPAIGLTVSVGVAQGAHAGGLSELELLLGQAEGALYRAREQGGNTVARAGA